MVSLTLAIWNVDEEVEEEDFIRKISGWSKEFNAKLHPLSSPVPCSHDISLSHPLPRVIELVKFKLPVSGWERDHDSSALQLDQ